VAPSRRSTDRSSVPGLQHFIDVPIKNYRPACMRSGFAIAANLDPDILLLDEICGR
jgi:ABC-type polysaccharide/polyol phosphate transport system ATPase subunit